MIDNIDDWKIEYRKDKTLVWTRVLLSNNKEYFFKDYDDFYEVRDICENSDMWVQNVKLQYRSNIVEESLEGFDGLYLVRSMIGKIGQDAINTMTIGKLKGDTVEKTIWSLPELIVRDNYEDTKNNCFMEAFILW